MNERVSVVDALRGFSLLGIIIANMLIFQYSLSGKEYMELFNVSGFDRGVYEGIKIFVESSTMPIFTFMFGFSLVKLADSFRRKEKRVRWGLFRRALFLITVGFLHSIYLWEGDILLAYGISCCFLLIFINSKSRTLLILFVLSVAIASSLGGVVKELSTTERKVIEQAKDVYANSTYSEIKQFRNAEHGTESTETAKDFAFILLFLPFVAGPLFWLGMWAAKTNWLVEGSFRRGPTLLLLAIALTVKIVGFYWWQPLYDFGALLLAVAYICCFVFVYRQFTAAKVYRYFEAVGRLSLTNYLMQTVICTTIYYGYGLGYFGTLGVWNGLVVAVLVYVGQLIVSYHYLQHFKQGPLEAILRLWTYGRKKHVTANERVTS